MPEHQKLIQVITNPVDKYLLEQAIEYLIDLQIITSEKL